MTEPTKHTPGPWVVRAAVDVWIMAGPIHVATIPRAHDGDWSSANARLIAAAPELLDALKQCLSALGSMYHDQFDGVWTDGDFDRELSPFRAAIAKAEGQE